MHNDNESGEIRIYRFDPQVDKQPRYDVFRAPYKGYTVLNVLGHIYEHLDPSLAYRAGCLGKGSARCGACSVLVNGVPALSCEKMAEQNMTIEPHPRFEVIRDLVCDFNKMRADVPLESVVQITVDKAKCVGCGDCVRICPVHVYSLVKVDGKLKAEPADRQNCCGATCLSCAMHCWKDAITITPDAH